MTKRDFSDDMRRLAAVIDRRIAEYNARHRRKRFAAGSASRILNAKRQNPGIFTIRGIATRLETTVGDLLEEPILGEADRKKVREHVEFLIERFDLMGIRAAEQRDEQPFDVPESDFVEREYDYPRPHHVWIVPNAQIQAGQGIESPDFEMSEVLHSIRDVYTGELRVIRVIGRSMEPVLRHDDKVTVDTRLTKPRDGDVVAIYHHHDGGILGYWHRGEDGTMRLEKANEAFLPIDLEDGGPWTLWGTVTRIVDTPVHPRPRPS